MERLQRLTRAKVLRRFKKSKSPDRSTSPETPLPSEPCEVCGTLRSIFTSAHAIYPYHVQISLETFETTCSGHGPMFDFLRHAFAKQISEKYRTQDNDTTNNGGADSAQSRTGESSERTEEIGESNQSVERPRKGRDPMFFEFITYPDGTTKTHEVLLSKARTSSVTLSLQPLMARLCYEPQTPGFGRVLDPEWVDLELVRQWKRDCLAQHNDKCRNPLQIRTVSPAWVIDTTKECIVPGTSIPEYVALSYRWGVSGGFRTTRHLLKAVQEPGALSQGSGLGNSMAPILRHAMRLTQAIDERYLWIDAVCIVQDDESHCATQLGMMGAIYARAKLTIVATDGDAMDGILGLKGISPPRQANQKVVPMFEREKLIFRDPPKFRSAAWYENPKTSTYFDRGWTYQEYYLSQRRLTFAKGQIYWHCSCADWEEDVIQPEDTITGRPDKNDTHFLNRLVLQRRPDFGALNWMLSEYNGRSLSFPEDALPGISGLLSILSRSFAGGFLFGMPEIAFDSALMWRSSFLGNMKKRKDSGKKNLLAVASRLPSWSWVSWEGSKFDVLDEETFDMLANTDNRSRTIPITQWFTHETPKAIEKRRIDSDWFRLREKFSDITCELPEGWTRTKNQGYFGRAPEGLGQYLYQHTAIPYIHFWLPVPILSVDGEIDLPGPAQTPYISCNTKRGRFNIAHFPRGHFRQFKCPTDRTLFHAGLLDGSGNYCGRLYLQELDDIPRFPEAESGGTCDVEIVAICRRREVKSMWNSWRVDGDEEGLQWTDSRRRTGRKRRTDPVFKDVYGVLWVEWIDGVAYRRASGVVGKDEWEGHDLEDVHLILG